MRHTGIGSSFWQHYSKVHTGRTLQQQRHPNCDNCHREASGMDSLVGITAILSFPPLPVLIGCFAGLLAWFGFGFDFNGNPFGNICTRMAGSAETTHALWTLTSGAHSILKCLQNPNVKLRRLGLGSHKDEEWSKAKGISIHPK